MLKNRSILITGASSGIGRATAELFLENGWRVGVLARRAEKLHQIFAAYDNAVVVPADVADEHAVAQAFRDFRDQTSRLDVVFNNAGMFGPTGTIDDISVDDWMKTLSVNVAGAFMVARFAFKYMRQQNPMGGRIINNGSISAYTPRAGAVCYTTTKHAMTGLTKSLALDGRAYNIACGQIDIGNAESQMVAELKVQNPHMETMRVCHAAESVLHMANLPLSANVLFMTVMATKMPYVGRG
ncbi:MAG: SDR family NAD(P)-dependent oxidoreductase [Aestuariivita sp.]|nr:SDR family NAD(P)-dependent oxidoreductase [Aestuariivita sp.]